MNTEHLAPTPEEIAKRIVGRIELLPTYHRDGEDRIRVIDNKETHTRIVLEELKQFCATERAAREQAEAKGFTAGKAAQAILETRGRDAFIADKKKELHAERDQLRNELLELKQERDALRVEYESRAEWIKTMNEILGHDNSDGFHSKPSPHELARQLVAQLQIAREDSKRLREDLRTVTRDRNEWREHAQAETECPNCKSAEAQLQIAREALETIEIELDRYRGGSTDSHIVVVISSDTAKAALAQITDPPSQSFGGAGGKEKK